ncbi:PDZ domain-containing protein [Sporosarcina thermotolerans]|uniref:PDZ domain-containing protein n=1 Tax=Sporosarcina thermotolerans TaxID=633404 RepID=A0AAW9A9W9_9BACL|nr:PDZ domain-containing protein [Sporosarcina thermotolerans]MDW0116989.1 PDZ domain-containing protein [Sporosarcina thermotolerans]WHT47899.1 PDZ domain-containing protein [Sporosarcina thermotolerans]
MSENVIVDLLKAVGLFFLNPVWLIALGVAVGLGYFRVKRERRSFLVRLLPGLTEMKRLLAESWMPALILSILISGVGLTVEVSWIVLFSAIAILSMISFLYQTASPIYFATIAFFGLYALERFMPDFTFRGWTIGNVDLLGDMALTVAVIAGLFLVAEGFLIRRHTVHYASPFLTSTNRGLRAAAYKSKRLWLLPIVFLVPGDFLSAITPYWPQFTLGGTTFSFLPVPIIIGFSQVARASFSDIMFPKIGRAVTIIGLIVVIIGISAYWLPILGWVALLVGFIGRAAITIFFAIRERKSGFAAVPKPTGVIIAGILPESPGEKLGLIPGECIRTVNGIQVTNEKELYDAIQVNAAHCRLQVIGRDGEVRLMQQVLYRHDHHRLGLLVVR